MPTRTRSSTFLREQGIDWDEARIRAAAPIVQEKLGRLGEFPEFARFLFEEVEPDPALLDATVLSRRRRRARSARAVGRAESSRPPLKALCERLDAKPKAVYLPIRVAVTGSRISPGLYESLELLGPRRLARAAAPRRRSRSVSAWPREGAGGRGRVPRLTSASVRRL